MGHILKRSWGIRLDWENIAVMRQRGWMELGFREDFLVRRFLDAGLRWQLWSDPHAHNAQVYEFRRWDEPMKMFEQSLTIVEEREWLGPDIDGRWAVGSARLGLPSHDGDIIVRLAGHGGVVRHGTLSRGADTQGATVQPGQVSEVRLFGRAAIPARASK